MHIWIPTQTVIMVGNKQVIWLLVTVTFKLKHVQKGTKLSNLNGEKQMYIRFPKQNLKTNYFAYT